MWRRFKRMVQSNLGRLSDMGGGGRGLTGDLEREARELERALKKAGEGLITVKGEVTFLEEKARKLARREEELAALEQAAITRGAEAAAGSYSLELARVKTERIATDRQLAIAREALERGQLAKAALQAQREQKLAEAREREKAYLELEREDLPAGVALDVDAALATPPLRVDAPSLTAPTTEPPRKTVGGPPQPAPIAEPRPAMARSAKTIGPEPGGEPPPPPPVSAPPSAAALKIKIKSREGDPTLVLERAAPEPVTPEPASAGKADTGAFSILAAEATSPAPASGPTDLVGELERLVRLREQGVLTEEELEQAKRRLLGPGAGA